MELAILIKLASSPCRGGSEVHRSMLRNRIKRRWRLLGSACDDEVRLFNWCYSQLKPDHKSWTTLSKLNRVARHLNLPTLIFSRPALLYFWSFTQTMCTTSANPNDALSNLPLWNAQKVPLSALSKAALWATIHCKHHYHRSTLCPPMYTMPANTSSTPCTPSVYDMIHNRMIDCERFFLRVICCERQGESRAQTHSRRFALKVC